MPAVQCMCTGNAIITFFTPFDPVPCDKKCRSEHQTLFLVFGGGVWGGDYFVDGWGCSLTPRPSCMCEKECSGVERFFLSHGAG